MVRPISLGLSQRQNALLQRARLKLDYAQRARIDKSYDANLQRRAHDIVARVKEQRRLHAAADNAARRALLLIGDVYDRLVEASDDEIDRASWRSRQHRVETELKRVLKGARP
jgi:hypothetical protein